MILLIDHYDSFTYNLSQYLQELGKNVQVVRPNQITFDEIEHMNPEAIVLSPGPGKPEEATQTIEIVRNFYQQTPILGICLGHQIIAKAFGATVSKAKRLMHGKRSFIRHQGSGAFQFLPQPLEVMRYHSLAVDPLTLPPFFKKVAIAMDDGELMAIEHQAFPVVGWQFHPESIGTETGKQLLENFLKETTEVKIK
ncbi:aminodeoxychorismate/anthranilate synthase component II [Halalkalibacillus sediminis]|uniref:Aminodeoxychorismate/anthranilate synthase component II n=1 Tax=Halalkalibacillus sediminis TaxID=2018042 RepID=A0A2I0QS23_9BACI|nr:aminodeoxychorismate/anthranilate synthase component II [Halalkalibacillus sediminis]PKR77142.1 aminodeoxychorismate/anthranilate synthase component II [Halalkalibacillus sediminis]